MSPYGPEPETPGARRQVTMAGVVLVAALAVPYSSQGFQQQIAVVLQGSALAPFIAMQERLAEGRARADQIDFLQAELDSIVSVTATQAGLVDENRELRAMLGLAERVGPRFLSATLLRPGTPGSESMFLVNVGAEQGVVEGAPVVSARGLVGRILEVRPRSAVGMDWTHPDFRASGMLADGSMSGMVENVRGDFREEDRLMLNGTAYHESAPKGGLVVTSGLGGVFPRGIPIGRIDATAGVQGSWRKSYWLQPLVDPGAVTHVLVETVVGGPDVTDVWVDSTANRPDTSVAPPPRRTTGRQGPEVRTPPVAAPAPAPTNAPARPAVPPPSVEAAPTPDTADAPADSAQPGRDSVRAPAAVDSPRVAPDSVPPGRDSVRVPTTVDSTRVGPDSAGSPPDSVPRGDR